MTISGVWSGPTHDATIDYTINSPAMSPFTSVVGGGSSIDRLLTLRSIFNNTTAFFTADDIPGSGPVDPDAQVRYIVVGYI